MLKRGINILEMSMLSYNKSKTEIISYSCMAMHIGKVLFCLAAKDLDFRRPTAFTWLLSFVLEKGREREDYLKCLKPLLLRFLSIKN